MALAVWDWKHRPARVISQSPSGDRRCCQKRERWSPQAALPIPVSSVAIPWWLLSHLPLENLQRFYRSFSDMDRISFAFWLVLTFFQILYCSYLAIEIHTDQVFLNLSVCMNNSSLRLHPIYTIASQLNRGLNMVCFDDWHVIPKTIWQHSNCQMCPRPPGRYDEISGKRRAFFHLIVRRQECRSHWGLRRSRLQRW